MKITSEVSARLICKGFYEIDVLPKNSETGVSFYLHNNEKGLSPWELDLIGGPLTLHFATKKGAIDFCEALSRVDKPEIFQD